MTGRALTRSVLSVADVDALVEQLGAADRWGLEDQAGAANEVTRERVITAAGCVRSGQVIPLSLPMSKDGPMRGAGGRVNPQHLMLRTGSDHPTSPPPLSAFTDDALYTPLQASTQWDALAHAFFRGRGYNGAPASSVDSGGASVNGIENFLPRSVSRGVLLDVARWLGLPWLEPGDVIHASDLEACAEDQGVAVGAGDVVLVRTGQLAQVRSDGSWGSYAGGRAPGLGLDTATFLCGRRVAAVASDTWGLEALPYETADVVAPLHMVLLANAGVHIGEMWDLEAWADAAAADRVYDGLLAAVPLHIPGAVGSPVSPVIVR